MQIGQYIASNGGVVAAEELAPYLDIKTAEKTMVGLLKCYIFFLFLSSL